MGKVRTIPKRRPRRKVHARFFCYRVLGTEDGQQCERYVVAQNSDLAIAGLLIEFPDAVKCQAQPLSAVHCLMQHGQAPTLLA